MKTFNKSAAEHYDRRKDTREVQLWMKPKKDGTASKTIAAGKGVVGAVPVHFARS